MSLVRKSACLLVLAGCIVEAPGGKSAKSPDQLPRSVAASANPLVAKVNANFENKIEVVEALFRPGQLRLGEQAQVSVTMRVQSRVDRDYQVFVHVENAENPNERMNVDHRAAGGVRPTTEWNKGETLKDEFIIYAPPNSTAKALNVWFGFWHPDTGARLVLQNVDSVRNDGQNRILLARIPVQP